MSLAELVKSLLLAATLSLVPSLASAKDAPVPKNFDLKDRIRLSYQESLENLRRQDVTGIAYPFYAGLADRLRQKGEYGVGHFVTSDIFYIPDALSREDEHHDRIALHLWDNDKDGELKHELARAAHQSLYEPLRRHHLYTVVSRVFDFSILFDRRRDFIKDPSTINDRDYEELRVKPEEREGIKFLGNRWKRVKFGVNLNGRLNPDHASASVRWMDVFQTRYSVQDKEWQHRLEVNFRETAVSLQYAERNGDSHAAQIDLLRMLPKGMLSRTSVTYNFYPTKDNPKEIAYTEIVIPF